MGFLYCRGSLHYQEDGIPRQHVWSEEHRRTFFPSSMFQPLDEFHSQFPLVTKVPHGELYVVDPARPYQLSEHWRPILFTAFLHSHIRKSQRDCINNAFNLSNVGVLKLKDLNMLAFLEFERVEGNINSDHKEFCTFVEDLFMRYYGSSNLQQQFPEIGDFLSACEKGKDEEALRYNPVFLQDEELAILYSDMHRLLRQELKHRDKRNEALKILRELNKVYSNTRVFQKCQSHILLAHHLGNHKLKQSAVPTPALPHAQVTHAQSGVPTQALPHAQVTHAQSGVPTQAAQYPGTTLVDVCRIAVQHSIEDKVLTDARKQHPGKKDLLNKYTRVDYIRALRYMFSRYPGEALFLFKQEKVMEN